MNANRQNVDDSHHWIGTEMIETRFGTFEFERGYPTTEAAEKLYELRTFMRAVESYLHFVTAMSMFYMQKALQEFGLDAPNKLLHSWEAARPGIHRATSTWITGPHGTTLPPTTHQR